MSTLFLFLALVLSSVTAAFAQAPARPCNPCEFKAPLTGDERGAAAASVQLSAPSTIEMLRVGPVLGGKPPEVLIWTRTDKAAVRLVLTRDDTAAAGQGGFWANRDIVNLPAGEWMISFTGITGQAETSLNIRKWVTTDTKPGVVAWTAAPAFTYLADFFEAREQTRRIATQLLASGKLKPTPGVLVTDLLRTENALPAILFDTSAGAGNRGVQIGAFFTNDPTTVWFQLMRVPAPACRDTVQWAFRSAEAGTLGYWYVYVNDHDGYGNMLTKKLGAAEAEAAARRYCDKDLNALNFGMKIAG